MKTLFTLLIVLGLTATASATELKIKFRIFDDANNPIKGATVMLYNGNHLDTSFTADGSHVDLLLEYNKYYTLEIALNMFVTKRIIINSKMEVIDETSKYAFEIELTRKVMYKNVHNSDEVLDYPIAILEYDSLTKDFNYNETYKESSKSHFEQLRKKDIKF